MWSIGIQFFGESWILFKANSLEMYRRIVDAVPEGIWVVNTQGQTTFCNDRMAEILGTDVESLQKLSFFDPVFPSDLEAGASTAAPTGC
jgi:PAS domain S-box-containing protein